VVVPVVLGSSNGGALAPVDGREAAFAIGVWILFMLIVLFSFSAVF